MGQIYADIFTIKEHHLDTFGHINNATYLQLFEQARWDLIVERGFDFNKMRKEALGPVILEVNVKFLQEITLREQICIGTEVLDYKGKIGRLKQTVFKANGAQIDNKKPCCEAIFTFGLFDIKERKLVNPTDDWLKAIDYQV